MNTPDPPAAAEKMRSPRRCGGRVAAGPEESPAHDVWTAAAADSICACTEGGIGAEPAVFAAADWPSGLATTLQITLARSLASFSLSYFVHASR